MLAITSLHKITVTSYGDKAFVNFVPRIDYGINYAFGSVDKL